MNLVDEMNNLLTDDILDFCMSLFVDTRLSLDVKTQSIDIPPGFNIAFNFMVKNTSLIPKVISKHDIKAQRTAIAIESTVDPIRRMALWGDYVKKYGRNS